MATCDASIFPLSPFDLTSSIWGITMGYVVKSVDVGAVEAAAQRMVSKWRLLAGRLEWSEGLSTWLINIPVEEDVSHRIKFTTRRPFVPLSTPITPVSKASAEILIRPSIDFFRHSSTPTSLSAYASSDTPFVSIHVTEFTNCSCVGITIPHGVFDAYGAGLIVKYLNAELHEVPWQAPVYSQTNIMIDALNNLTAAPPLYAKDPTPLTNFRLQLMPLTIKNYMAYIVRKFYETFIDKHDVKALYLGENIVCELVSRVKEEAKKSGTWVSTADILIAWFFKVAFSREAGADLVHIAEAVSTRSVFAGDDPAFGRYLHNAFVWASLPPLSRDELADISLVDLAILHRQTIQSMRNMPFVQAYHHSSTNIGISAVPISRWGAEACMVSNHVSFQLPAIEFGSVTHAFWIWVTPWHPDNSFFVYVNEFEGGYLIETRLPKYRWDIFSEEMRKMTSKCEGST